MQISPERTDQAKLRSNWQWSKFSQSMNILTNKDQIDCANFRHIQLKGQVQSGKQTLLKDQVQSGWQTLLKGQVQSGSGQNDKSGLVMVTMPSRGHS